MRCRDCGRGFPLGTTHCSLDGGALVRARGHTLIGALLGGRYRVEHLIGSGGMGEVYKAQHVTLGRAVALKVLRPELSGSPKALAMLSREARNASRVEHLNAVRIFDLEADGELLFLSMDYVAGPNLVDVVGAFGALAPPLVAQVITQVASGLEAIHAMGIVHRDLKPSNVVLTRAAGGRGVAKLLDFGIARAFGEPDQSITQTGLTVGTPGFMSPEQRAALILDSRADVFSLAVLAVYLLAGRLPDLAPVACLRLADVPEAEQWPKGVQQSLLHGLNFERNLRASSALRFATALSNALTSMASDPSRPASIEAELARARWAHGELARNEHPTPVNQNVAVPASQTEKVAPLERSPSAPPSAAVHGPHLESVAGPLKSHSWAVGDEALLLGRDSRECQVALPSDATVVSRIHASLRWDRTRGSFLLQDEGSSNSTWLEDGTCLVPGVPVALAPGATFWLGNSGIRFRVRND